MTAEKKTVLFIDDEELMRDVAAMMFEEAEWPAFFASSGQQGLELFREHQGAIDVAIIDFSMPEKNGVETARELRAIAPELPILIISGLINEGELAELTDQKNTGFLRKPFRFDSLMAKFEEFAF